VIATIIDFILGDPNWLPHPIIYIGRLISKLENFFRKKAKSDKALLISGGAIVFTITFTTYLLPYVLLYIFKNNNYLFHIINITIIWTTLAAKSLDKAALEVYKPLIKGNIEEARVKLSYIVGRDTKGLNEKEIVRATVETISENTSDGVIAPMIYALIGGAPLAMMYKGINTMDSMLGYLNVKYKFIGYFPAKVDDFFNFIPARLTGILMCLISPFVGGNIVNTFKVMIRDRKNHKSPNCAYPEAATAAALKVQLGGSNSYFGEVMFKPTIGDNVRELEVNDIYNAKKIMYFSEILFLLLVYIFTFKG